jgi:hypothetical protein
MIKVYIYVTGLVLYQFSGDGSMPTRALLAAGGYDHPGLGHIHRHEVKTQVGTQFTEFFDLPTSVRFTVPSRSSNIVPVPDEITDLTGLAGNVKVRKECADFDHHHEQCMLPSTTQPALNSLLEFAGAWRAVALSDCGKAYPDRLEKTVEFDFVKATQAWMIKTPARHLANSVLFVAEVDSLADLQVSSSSLGSQLTVSPPEDCSKLPGFATSFSTGCVMMIIRNGSDEVYQGGGDLHFASLYPLLDTPPPAEGIWLPIKVDGEACEGGGGTGGLSRCVGGMVVQ